MPFAINQGLFLLDIVDHYAILGLPVDTEAKSVRKAYLQIAQRLHPDTCKAQGEADKQLASDLLSKLVNPAYEQLSKPASWSEYQVILKQLRRQLAQGSKEIQYKSAIAQELSQNDPDKITAAYTEKVKELSKSNYKNLAEALTIIGTLSELNLLYLKNAAPASTNLLTNNSASKQTQPPVDRTPPPAAASAKSTTPHLEAAKTTTSSSLEAAIWRGEQHLDKKNYAKAVLEFRDAIKLDPNCVKAHALMGISYLRQNQLAMAKVHIKKAYMMKASDPLARQAKQDLEKAMGSALDTQTGSKKTPNQKKGGLFGGLFGGKKK